MSMIENYMDEHMHEYTTFDQLNHNFNTTSEGKSGQPEIMNAARASPSDDYDSEIMNQMGPKSAAKDRN